MHRTTIPLEGPVERALRQLAAKERRSFKEIINDLLKRGLKAYASGRSKKVVFKWNTALGTPMPGFDPSDRSTYLDLISRKF